MFFSCDMKRHWLLEMAKWEIFNVFPHDMKKQMDFLMSHEEAWLVEMAKWEDGQYDGQWESPHAFLHDMEANAFLHVTWRCIDWLRWSMGDSSCISPWHGKDNAFPHVIQRNKCEFKWQFDEEALICGKSNFNFWLISNDKNHFKFNNFFSIGWKFMK
jgi:hypothetical protein